jgi:hypothetical protein
MIKIHSMIDDETINKVGLRLSDKPINAQIATDSRVFEYPHLDSVLVLESDLYGNLLPEDSCFLAFNGTHGLIGKDLKIERLRNATVEEIKLIVEANIEG